LELLEGRALLTTLSVTPGDPDAYPTISAAVAAAQPGDTINVSPGTYNESVVVKVPNITILGGQPTDADDPPSGPSIVNPTGGLYGFDVQADRVTIQGFTVQGDGSTNTVGFNLARSVSGDQLLGNVISNNTFGIYLNSDGVYQTVVANNLFSNNNAPGSAGGNGIYSDQGASNVLIQNNSFTGHKNASIIFVGPSSSQTNLTIQGNQISGGASPGTPEAAILLVNTTNSLIASNTITNTPFNGIGLFGGVSNVTIDGNTIRDCAGSGIDFAHPISDLTTPNTNNTVRNNTVENNLVDGIFFDKTSTGNTITHNIFLYNGSFDAVDKTGPTANKVLNTWHNNTGRTSSPRGLVSGSGWHHRHHRVWVLPHSR
jgi:parallel beta-helix repeat protein